MNKVCCQSRFLHIERGNSCIVDGLISYGLALYMSWVRQNLYAACNQPTNIADVTFLVGSSSGDGRPGLKTQKETF